MVEPNTEETSTLVEAVLVWTGWGDCAFPRRRYESLVHHFGADAAAALYPKIKTLEEEFYSSNAWQVAANLQDMARLVANHFRKKRPGVPEQIVQAFTWCYTWDHK